MKTRLILLIAAMTWVAALVAQAPKDLAFDVVAIKPSADTKAFSFSMVQPGGGTSART